MNAAMMRFMADLLRGRRNDPSWNMQGQPMPPQAMLDRPVQGFMQPEEGGSVGAEGLVDKVGGVAGVLADRERQRRRLLGQF